MAGTPQNMDEGANGLGIASMILGIVAILLACCAGGKWADISCRSCRSDSWNYRITETQVRQQQRNGSCGCDLQCDRASYENYCDHFYWGWESEPFFIPICFTFKVPF